MSSGKWRSFCLSLNALIENVWGSVNLCYIGSLYQRMTRANSDIISVPLVRCRGHFYIAVHVNVYRACPCFPNYEDWCLEYTSGRAQKYHLYIGVSGSSAVDSSE